MTNESFIKVNNKLVLVNGHPITIDNGSSSNLQENKAVTITANGTSTITPDEGYDGLSSVDVTVNVSGGGGAVSSGYSVTFPATANHWNKITSYAMLVLSDGSTVDFTDYSVVAGRTINNVIDIQVSAENYYILKLTLTAGTIVSVCNVNGGASLQTDRIEAPGTTPYYPYSFSIYFWLMPVEDIIISDIDLIPTGV